MTDGEIFRVEAHLERVRRCEREWRGLPVPTATPDGERYPLVYPRDTAVITRAYERLDELGGAPSGHVSNALRGAAAFMHATQDEHGLWGQRYDLDARDRSIYPQEDGPAHAVSILARHVLRERKEDAPSPIEDEALDAITRAVRGVREHLWRKDVGLVHSMTSIHESRLERGFTLWTNCAYVEALRQAHHAADQAGRTDRAAACRELLEALEEGVRERLVPDGGFVRRLTDDLEPDPRPDITLLAPSYFGVEDLAPEAEAAAAERAERELWDPDLGLLERYPADEEDMGIHLHGGNGPYLSFSNWLAQRHADHGDRERAREILDLIAKYATRDGDLPEHVATREAFDRFVRESWRTGLDFRKEFDDEVLREDVPVSDLLAEGARMTQAYAHAARTAEDAGDGVIRLAAPHAWTHAEFAVTLCLLNGEVKG